MSAIPSIWFPAVRCGTGTDAFTLALAAGLRARGMRAEITWLPHRAEYAALTLRAPQAPAWANIAHINTWLPARLAPKNVATVATLHHSIHDPALRPYKGLIRTAYHRYWIAPNERRLLRHADKVIAVSNFAAEMARSMLCDVPIETIHNGVDTSLFFPSVPSTERRPAKPFRLLYVGSWIARKGVDVLPLIMQKLGDEFTLSCVGNIPERQRVSLPSNIRSLGFLNKSAVLKAMQQADAFLFPSRSEGFPLAVLEAMACGLPVIATRCSSLPEIVDDRLSFDIDDVDGAVDSVRCLASDHEFWNSMCILSRAKVESHFNFETMLDGYQNAYNTLLARRQHYADTQE